MAEAGFGRLLCGTTLWEDAVKIIATTNTMWRQTVRMVELLVAKCGRDGSRFPTPREVVRFSEEELQRDCRLGYRAKTIHALASRHRFGAIDLEALGDRAQTDRGRFSRAIGRCRASDRTARRICWRWTGATTSSPSIRSSGASCARRYHGGRRVSDAAMLRRYTKWGRWKYLAYWSELWSEVTAEIALKKGTGEPAQ